MAQGNNKYSNDIKTKAMGLWALGKSFKEIAKELSVSSHRTVESWKQNNTPSSWQEYSEKLRSDSVEKMKKSQLDSIEQVKIRQQQWIKVIGNHSIRAIIQNAKKGTLEPKVAMEALKFICEMELKLYVPLDQLFGHSHIQTSSKTSIMHEMLEKQQNKRIMENLGDAFEKAHSLGKYAKPEVNK